MDRETLERLATDRAMGAMTTEAEQLLDAYVAGDASAAKIVRDIESTVHAARRALRDQLTPSSLPAFPVAGFQQIERWRQRVRVLAYAGSLAACILLGIGVGRLYSPAVPPQSDPMVVAPKPVSPIAASETNVGRYASEAGFWSIERLRKQHDQMEPKTTRAADTNINQQWRQALKPT